MNQHDLEEERRLRRAALTRLGFVPDIGQEPEDTSDQDVVDDHGMGDLAAKTATDEEDNEASRRMEQKTLWVDFQVRKAMERGEFDNLPGTGKPLKLPDQHDPDWWVKRLIEREQITGVAPPAIGLRREEAELESVIDREWSQEGVRRVVAEFNRRVVEARRQLTGGPPVITKTREVEDEVAAWAARRAARRELARRRREAERAQDPGARATRSRSARWLLRRLRHR